MGLIIKLGTQSQTSSNTIHIHNNTNSPYPQSIAIPHAHTHAHLLVHATTAQHLSALVLADLQVLADLLHLLLAGLRTHHDRGVQGVAHLDLLRALHHTLHESGG